MKAESTLAVEIWGLFSETIPQTKRGEAALSLMHLFEDFGMDQRDLADVVDEDPHLARAYQTVFDDGIDDDEADGYGDDE